MNENHVYTVFPSSSYKQTRKLAKKQGLDMDLLDWGIDQLAQDVPLPLDWKNHQLKGNMKRFRGCHIGGAGDWLLVYEKRSTGMVLYLLGTGSHAEIKYGEPPKEILIPRYDPATGNPAGVERYTPSDFGH